MPMPAQKPGKSKQDYGTPPELLAAIKFRLNTNFDLDVAADDTNAICDAYYTEEIDGLSQPWCRENCGWNWCNPPYGNIEPWVEKAYKESRLGANTVVLIPLSISEWWIKWVENKCYIVKLHGRIKFVGAEQGYPKDCALLLYTQFGFIGEETWDWRRAVPQLHEPELGED
jgi:phage N-6-adenine-methyltransferase